MLTRLGAGRSGVGIPVWTRDSSLLQNNRTGSGSTQLPVQWVPMYLPGVKVAAA
jgi:hypothetical protein